MVIKRSLMGNGMRRLMRDNPGRKGRRSCPFSDIVTFRVTVSGENDVAARVPLNFQPRCRKYSAVGGGPQMSFGGASHTLGT